MIRRTKKESGPEGSVFRTRLGAVVRSVAAITASVTLVATGLSGDVTPASAANGSPDRDANSTAAHGISKPKPAKSAVDETSVAANDFEKAVNEWAAGDSVPGKSDKGQGSAADDAHTNQLPHVGVDTNRSARSRRSISGEKNAIPAPSAFRFGQDRSSDGTADHTGYEKCSGSECDYYTYYPPSDAPKQGNLPLKQDPSRVCGVSTSILVDTSTNVTPGEMDAQKQGVFAVLRAVANTKQRVRIIPFARTAGRPGYVGNGVGPARYWKFNAEHQEPSVYDPIIGSDIGSVQDAARKMSDLQSSRPECAGTAYGYGSKCGDGQKTNWLNHYRGANYAQAIDQVGQNGTAFIIGEGKPTAPYGSNSSMEVQDIEAMQAAQRANNAHIWSFVTGVNNNDYNYGNDTYGQNSGYQRIRSAAVPDKKCLMSADTTPGRDGIVSQQDRLPQCTTKPYPSVYPWDNNNGGNWTIPSVGNLFQSVDGVSLQPFYFQKTQNVFVYNRTPPANDHTYHYVHLTKEQVLKSSAYKQVGFATDNRQYFSPDGSLHDMYWSYGASGTSLMNTISDRVSNVTYDPAGRGEFAPSSLPDQLTSALSGCEPAKVTLQKRLADDPQNSKSKSGFTFESSRVLANYTPNGKRPTRLDADNFLDGVSTTRSNSAVGPASGSTNDDGSVSKPFYAPPIDASKLQNLSDSQVQQVVSQGQKIDFKELMTNSRHQEGYKVESVTCTVVKKGQNDQGTPTGTVTNQDTGTFSISHLSPGQEVNCTVVNKKMQQPQPEPKPQPRPTPSDNSPSIRKTVVAEGPVTVSDSGAATVAVVPGNNFDIKYKIQVNNNSNSPHAYQVTERPQTIPGFRVTGVTFSNDPTQTVPFIRTTRTDYPACTDPYPDRYSGGWTLQTACVNRFYAKGRQFDHSNVFATVHYVKDDQTTPRLKQLLASDPGSVLQCYSRGDGSYYPGYGLVNDASTRFSRAADEVHSQACVNVVSGSSLTITKTAYDSPANSVATWNNGNGFIGEYLVSVINDGSTAKTPSKIVERPVVPVGFTGISKVEFAPVDNYKLGRNGGGQLLRGTSSYVAQYSSSDKGWVIDASHLNAVQPASRYLYGRNRSLVKVIVHYTVGAGYDAFSNSDSHTCSSGGIDPRKGAVNSVESFENVNGNDVSDGVDNACLNIVAAGIAVAKSVNGSSAKKPVDAVTADADSNVNIVFRLTNTGDVPLQQLRLADRRLTFNPDKGRNGYDAGASVDLSSLSCGGGYWYSRVASDGSVTIASRFGNSLGPNRYIDCNLRVSAQDATAASGADTAYYGDEVSASGTPDSFDPGLTYPSGSDTGWFKVNKTVKWSVTKEAPAQPVVITDQNKDDFSISYVVSVGKAAGSPSTPTVPPAIIETPSSPSGFVVSSIEVSGTDRDSLVDGDVNGVQDNRDGSFTIPSTGFKAVGVSPLKLSVVVHYALRGGRKLNEFGNDDLDCRLGGGFVNKASISGTDSNGSACASTRTFTGSGSKLISGLTTTKAKPALVFGDSTPTKVTYTYTNEGTQVVHHVGLSDKVLSSESSSGREVLGSKAKPKCTLSSNNGFVLQNGNGESAYKVWVPSGMQKGDTLSCTVSLNDAQMAFDSQGNHHDVLTLTPEEPGFSTKIVRNGYAFKVPSLVGNLPKSGGSGVWGFGLGGFVLLALGGLFAALTRKKVS